MKWWEQAPDMRQAKNFIKKFSPRMTGDLLYQVYVMLKMIAVHCRLNKQAEHRISRRGALKVLLRREWEYWARTALIRCLNRPKKRSYQLKAILDTFVEAEKSNKIYSTRRSPVSIRWSSHNSPLDHNRSQKIRTL